MAEKWGQIRHMPQRGHRKMRQLHIAAADGVTDVTAITYGRLLAFCRTACVVEICRKILAMIRINKKNNYY